MEEGKPDIEYIEGCRKGLYPAPIPHKLSQRVKDSPITIESQIGGETFKITANSSAWENLQKKKIGEQDMLTDFLTNFVHHAILKIKGNRKKLPRGIQKEKKEFYDQIKIFSAYIYNYTKFWLQKNKDEWETPFRNIVELIEEIYSDYAGDYKKEMLSPENVAFFITGTCYEMDWDEFNSDIFQRNYLSSSRNEWIDNEYYRVMEYFYPMEGIVKELRRRLLRKEET